MKTNSILFTLLTFLLSACGADLNTNLLVPDAAEQDEFLLGQDGTRQFRGHFLYLDQMVDPVTDPTSDGVSGDFILTFLQANSDDHTKIWQVSGDLNGTVTVYNNPVADFKTYSLQTQNVDVEISKPKHQNSAILSGRITEAIYSQEEGRLVRADDGNCFRFAGIGEMCWGEMTGEGPGGSGEFKCDESTDGDSNCVVGSSGNNAGHVGTSNIEDDPTSDNN